MGNPQELDLSNPQVSSEGQFKHPDWWFESMRAAALLEEKGKDDDAARIVHEANMALAVWKGSRATDNMGNPILGENDSSQHEELAKRLRDLLKK